jgi:hypothetical protein
MHQALLSITVFGRRHDNLPVNTAQAIIVPRQVGVNARPNPTLSSRNDSDIKRWSASPDMVFLGWA